MKIDYKCILILFLILVISCEDKTKLEDKDEVIDEIKYKSYKRIIPMLEADRKLIENRSDVDNAKRYIIKAFDDHEININKNSSSEE